MASLALRSHPDAGRLPDRNDAPSAHFDGWVKIREN
jgi:hypothetical protein